MGDQGDPVSVAILSLLSFITIILTGYLSLYCYSHYKARQGKLSKHAISSSSSNWLEPERKPLIPGNFHTQTIQPVPVPVSSREQEFDESLDDLDLSVYKERDFSELGRIIFVIRYNKKREELMVRLVQIEGMPATQELYCPNSAYVDVGLKYTGDLDETESEANQKPPRLDICLQQVYYFIISAKQMLFHSLEFRINAFDEQFRRYVCGMVEVKLSEEMGEDIFNGNEVVFVEDILEPFQVSYRNFNEHKGDGVRSDTSVENDDDSQKEDYEGSHDELEILSRALSCSSSNMSWEPEVSRELLSISTNSIWNKCISMQDLHYGELSEGRRAHSIGYLPTYEWTVKDIPLDDGIQESDTPVLRPTNTKQTLHLPISEPIDPNPTPESFYHIVPVTPSYNADVAKSKVSDSIGPRHLAYKKLPTIKRLARSLTMKRSALKVTKKSEEPLVIERSSSCPSLSLSEKSQSPE